MFGKYILIVVSIQWIYVNGLLQGTKQQQMITAAISCANGANFQRDAVDCSTYYQCLSTTTLSAALHCGTGLVFNQIAEYCDYPANVNDCPGSSPTSPTTAPVVAPTTAPVVAPTSAPVSSTGSLTCPVGAQFIRDPVDCGIYYQCMNGSPAAAQSCGSTMVFNLNMGYCDYPANVNDCPGSAPVAAPTASPITSPVASPTALPTASPVSAPVAQPTSAPVVQSPTAVPTVSSTESNYTYNFGAKYERGCYFTNWAQFRNSPYNYGTADIDPSLCTIIYYAFAKITPGFKLVEYEWNDGPTWGNIGQYAEVLNLKKRNPELRVLLSVGGWRFNDCKEEPDSCSIYSDMASNKDNRKIFIDSSINLLRSYGFDGLDLDWEFPAYPGHNGVDRLTPQDKQNFVSLVKEFRAAAFVDAYSSSKSRLMITAAVGVGYDIMEGGYDVEALCNDNTGLDIVNLMSYDYHGPWGSMTHHNSPLHSSELDLQTFKKDLSCEGTVNYWLQNKCSPQKLLLGLSTYGRGFAINSNQGFFTPATGPSKKFEAFKPEEEDGIYTFAEMKKMIKKGWLTEAWDEDRSVPYAYNSTTWIGYDNEKSITAKAEFIKKKGLLGGMLWTLDFDDFGNKEYPLLRRMNSVLLDGPGRVEVCPAAEHSKAHGRPIIPQFPEGVWDGADCSLKTLRKLPTLCKKKLNAASSEEERLACQLISQPRTKGKFPFGVYPAELSLDEPLWNIDSGVMTPLFTPCALARMIDDACFSYVRNELRASYEFESNQFSESVSEKSGVTDATKDDFHYGAAIYTDLSSKYSNSRIATTSDQWGFTSMRRAWRNDYGTLSMRTCVGSAWYLKSGILNDAVIDLWRSFAATSTPSLSLFANPSFVKLANSGLFVPVDFRYAVEYTSKYHAAFKASSTVNEDTVEKSMTDKLGASFSKVVDLNPSIDVTYLQKISNTIEYSEKQTIVNGRDEKYGDCRFDHLIAYPAYWSVILGACAKTAAENMDNLRPATYVPKGGFLSMLEILTKIGITVHSGLLKAFNVYFGYCKCTSPGSTKTYQCFLGDGKLFYENQSHNSCTSTFWWLRNPVPHNNPGTQTILEWASSQGVLWN